MNLIRKWSLSLAAACILLTVPTLSFAQKAEFWIAVALWKISEHLVIASIFLNDIKNMFDGSLIHPEVRVKSLSASIPAVRGDDLIRVTGNIGRNINVRHCPLKIVGISWCAKVCSFYGAVAFGVQDYYCA